MVFANPVLPSLRQASLRALAVLCLGALAGCHGKADDKPATAPPAPVEVQPAARGEMLAVYSGTAPIEADGEAVVVAKVGGELRQLLVEEGAYVRKGQVLAKLDGERLRLEAAQTKAQLSKLERDYKRNVELQQRGLVAVSAFENLRYEVDAARAAYELTALQLSYTDIRAPIDGVVAERFVKAGNTLNPNDKLFRIADLSPLVAHVHVPESELRKLRAGQVASVQVDAAGGAFQSIIQRISPVVDSNTGTFKVTLELRDPGNKLKPGMFARIDIVHERRADVVRIARSALLEDDGNQRVFVVQGGKAVSRAVTLGLTNGPLVEVLSGVGAGDPVVVVGQGTLKDGSPVRVVPSTTPAGPAPPAAVANPVPAPAAR
jgi:membrane fusion protein (multidrug efflux system)